MDPPAPGHDDRVHHRIHGPHQYRLRHSHHGAELKLDQKCALGFASGVLFLGYGISQPLGGWIADRGYGRALIADAHDPLGRYRKSPSAIINTPTELAVVRFALGFFEGGIFPTMLLFVRTWFAPSERAPRQRRLATRLPAGGRC